MASSDMASVAEELMLAYKQDLVHDRLRSVSNLKTMANRLTPPATRYQLIPFISNQVIVDCIRTGDTDVLLVLATTLGDMVSFVGGPFYAHLLLPLFEKLCVVDHPDVVEKATQSLANVLQCLPLLSICTFNQFLDRLCNHEHAAARLSAVALISRTIPLELRAPILAALHRARDLLNADNDPRVREAANVLLASACPIGDVDIWCGTSHENDLRLRTIQSTRAGADAQNTQILQGSQDLQGREYWGPFFDLGRAIGKTLFTQCPCSDTRFTRQTSLLAVWMALFFYVHVFQPHSNIRHAVDTFLFWVGGFVFNVVLFNCDMIWRWICNLSCGFVSGGNFVMQCNICDHEKFAVAFSPCGHTCCQDCSAMIGATCPYCRKPISDCIPIFH